VQNCQNYKCRRTI